MSTLKYLDPVTSTWKTVGGVGPAGPVGPPGPPGTSFPDAPVDGKTYGRKDGAWSEAGAGGYSETDALSSPPSLPKVGDRWYVRATSKLYTRVNDGSSEQWVEF